MSILTTLITGEIDRLVRNRTNFTKPELVRALERSPKLVEEFRRLKKRGTDLDLDKLMERGLVELVNRCLRKTDHYKFRLYESCKPEGSAAWIWFKMASVTENQLLLIIQSTRVRERGLRLKRERYQIFADRLGQLAEGTTLGDIYEDVAPVAARYQTK